MGIIFRSLCRVWLTLCEEGSHAGLQALRFCFLGWGLYGSVIYTYIWAEGMITHAIGFQWTTLTVFSVQMHISMFMVDKEFLFYGMAGLWPTQHDFAYS